MSSAPCYDNVSVDDPVYGATALQQMLASCTGAVITSLTMTPLDVVKIRLQAQQRHILRQNSFIYCNGLMDHLCICPNGANCHGASNGIGCHSATPHVSHSSSSAAASGCAWYKRPCPSPYSGPVDAALRIARAEGVTSLWSGLLPTLVLAVPATLLYFTCYDQLRVRLQRASWLNSERQRAVVAPLVAGTMARVCATTVVAPLELVRTRLQAGRWTYARLFSSMTSEFRHGRFLSLWRGLTPTLIRDVPFSAIYWCCYELLKRQLLVLQIPRLRSSPSSGCVSVSATRSFLAGALAGSLAAVVTLPFDVVKTHWQIEFGRSEAVTDSGTARSKTHRGVSATLSAIYRQQGLSGLFVGIAPRLVKVAPACAIMVTSYEMGKILFLKHNLKKRAPVEVPNHNYSD